MTTMRAKVNVLGVIKHEGFNSETVEFRAVPKPAYDSDGTDEDNTFAKFSPSAVFTIQIANPALLGKFETGQQYYVDFTPAPTP
jgi:hypothetical protein